MAKRLQTRGVFACDCEILTHTVKVGILVIDESEIYEPQRIVLVNPENNIRYPVFLDVIQTTYKHEMKRV